MKWIGLTGGLASGKSTVARLLRLRGYPVIDADELAKDVVAPGTPGLRQIFQEFGEDVRAEDGSLDRRALGRKVFGFPERLLRLESIIHPLVQAETNARRRAFATQGFRLAFYDVPLLFEKKLVGFDAILVVTATEEIRRARIKSRDNLSDEEIERRLASQIPMTEKEKGATYLIHNQGDLSSLEAQIDELLRDHLT